MCGFLFWSVYGDLAEKKPLSPRVKGDLTKMKDFSCHSFSNNLSNFFPCLLLFSFSNFGMRVFCKWVIHESTLIQVGAT